MMNMSRHKNAPKIPSGIRLESSFLRPIEPQSILGRSRTFRDTPIQRNTSGVKFNAPGHYLNNSRSIVSSNQRRQHELKAQLKIKQLEEQLYQQQQMQRCYSSSPPVYSQIAESGPAYNPGPLNHNYCFICSMLNPNASIIESFNLNVAPSSQWPMQFNFNMTRSVSCSSKSVRPSFMDLQKILAEEKMQEFFETIGQLKETKYLDPLEKMLLFEQFLTIIENERAFWVQRSEQARMDEEIHRQQQNPRRNLERIQTWMESSEIECGNVAPPLALAPSSVPLVASGVWEPTVRTGQRSINQGNVYEESIHQASAYEESIHQARASQAEGVFQETSQSEESDEPVAEVVVRRGTYGMRDWTILKGDGPTDLKITGILINMLTRKMVENCHISENIAEVTKSNVVKTKLCTYMLDGKFQNPGNAVPPKIANHFSGGRFPEQWRELAKKWRDTERNAVLKTKKNKTENIENPGILSTPVSNRRRINMNSSVLTRSMAKKQRLGLFGMQF